MHTLALKQTQKSVADTIVDELVTLARTEPDVVAPIAKKSRAKKAVVVRELRSPMTPPFTNGSEPIVDGAVAKKSRAKKVVSEPVSELVAEGAEPIVAPKKSRAKKAVVSEPIVDGTEPVVAKKSRAKKAVVSEPIVDDGADKPIVISESVIEADTEAKPIVVKKSRAKKAVVEPVVETQVIAELTADSYEPVAKNTDIPKKSRDKKTIVTVDDAVEIDAKPAKKTNAKPRTKKNAEKPTAEEPAEEPAE